MKSKINGLMFYYRELSLEEGFRVLAAERNAREVDGMKVSAPSGIALWKTCNETSVKMKCFNCGVEADRWIVRHQHNDTAKPPVVELFAYTNKNRLVMMTRDHIIPKSWGGLNVVENLRPACEPCNHFRKNKLEKEDEEFMKNNPHLRIAKTPVEYNNEKVSHNKKSIGDPTD